MARLAAKQAAAVSGSGTGRSDGVLARDRGHYCQTLNFEMLDSTLAYETVPARRHARLRSPRGPSAQDLCGGTRCGCAPREWT
eukprot:scaffold35841_cov46-Phaeocystis_antarctica.AAC.5